MKIEENLVSHLKLEKPAVIVDEQVCRANIRAMSNKAKSLKIELRPHFKTHRSRTIGNWFREEGIDKITVSSVDMAAWFANDGWNDITIAIPVNLREIDKINLLANKVKLGITVDNLYTMEYLSGSLSGNINIWIKLDDGSGRVGIPLDDIRLAVELAEIAGNNLNFAGFITHNGSSYKCTNSTEIKTLHNERTKKLCDFMRIIKDELPCKFILSAGDTPSCSLVNDFGCADEIRPGNFVFYDLMQYHMGVCSFNSIALAMALPVIGVYPGKIVVYGGAVHLSKESIEVNGNKVYGKVCRIEKNGFSEIEKEIFISSLSQEHGIIYTNIEHNLKPGDLIGVIPVHSCLTADMFDNYTSLNGSRIDACK